MCLYFQPLSVKVLALAELVKLGQCDAIEKMLEAAERLEKSKTGTASGLQAGAVMAEVLCQTCYVKNIFKLLSLI